MKNFNKKKIIKGILCIFVLAFLVLIPFGAGADNIGEEAGQAVSGITGWFTGVAGTLLEYAVEGIGEVVSTIISFLLEAIIIPVASWILTVVGNTLDHAINFSLNSANLINNSGIKVGWTIVRDFINMIFIFVLLYISISTILGNQNTHAKKTLASLIMAALFINFSMFVAGLVIDATNILALTFKNALVFEGGSDGGLSAIVMNAIKLAETYEPAGGGFAGISTILSAGIRLFLISITIYALFMACILFLARIISFVLLLVTSPIGFIGGILPKFKTYASQWWETLIGQAVVAPIFLFFFYVIAQLTQNRAFFASAGSSSSVDITYYFNFAIVIGLILASVSVTKKMSGEIGKGALSAFKTTAGLVGGAYLGTAAMMGRSVLGRGAAMTKSAFGEKLTQQSVEGKNWVVRGAAKFANKGIGHVEKSSFDLRSVKIAGKGLSDVPGVKLGKAGGEGGFAKKVKDTTKSHRDYMDNINKMNISDTEKEKLKKKYAESLKSPWWMAGRVKVDPKTPIGNTLRHVRAGGVIGKELEQQKKIKDLERTIKKEKNDATRAGLQDDLQKAREKLKKMKAEEKKKD